MLYNIYIYIICTHVPIMKHPHLEPIFQNPWRTLSMAQHERAHGLWLCFLSWDTEKKDAEKDDRLTICYDFT